MKPTVMRLMLLGSCLLLSPWLLANSQLEQAQSLLQQSKTDEALEITNDILTDNPGNIEARFMKGLILTRQEKLSEAENVFNELTNDHPDLPEPYNNLAVVYAAQGKFEEAKQALSRAINTHPSYATAHENLGDIYAKMASRAYNQALELDDDNASAREKLSMISELFSNPSKTETSTEQTASTSVAKASATQSDEATQGSSLQPKPVISPEPAKQQTEAVVESTEVIEAAVSKIEIDPAVETAVLDWAVAWSSQDVDRYLSFYSDDFVPPENLSLNEWQQQRRVRLSKPEFINIELTSMAINMTSSDTASAIFTQSYSSDTYQDKVKKKLLLHKQNNEWKILEEISI